MQKNKITASCLLMQRFGAAIRKERIFNFSGERMINQKIIWVNFNKRYTLIILSKRIFRMHYHKRTKQKIVINYELSDRAIKQLYIVLFLTYKLCRTFRDHFCSMIDIDFALTRERSTPP